MKKDPHCHWCGILVVYYDATGGKLPDNFATIDHLYDKYHPDKRKQVWKERKNYIVLACNRCNQQRGREATKAIPKELLQERSRRAQQRIALGLKVPRSELFSDLIPD